MELRRIKIYKVHCDVRSQNGRACRLPLGHAGMHRGLRMRVGDACYSYYWEDDGVELYREIVDEKAAGRAGDQG